MTASELREALILTALSASTMISGVQDDEERERLERLFRETFDRERQAARLNRRAFA